MADDWAGLSAQLGKMQQIWYVTQRSYWSVFDPNSDTATITSEDGSARVVPSWRALSQSVANGVTLNTAQTITGEKTFSQPIKSDGSITAGDFIKTGQLNGAMSQDSDKTGLETRNIPGSVGDAGMALMAFHCQGYYGVKLGLRHDGIFGLGGWSAAPWRWHVDVRNGNMTAAGSVTGLSDIRLKTNVRRIQNALGKVNRLGGYTYDRLDNKIRQAGLIAQEVRAVLPEAVIEGVDDEKILSVAYGNVAALLVEAIRELSMQVDFLSHRVNELEGGS